MMFEVPSTFNDESLVTTQKGLSQTQYRVIRRNGQLTSFDAEKIRLAITKAFLAVEKDAVNVEYTVEELTNEVVNAVKRRAKETHTIHIEDIQDQVELALMRAEKHKVARAYVIYREQHAKQRIEQQKEKPVLHVTDKQGNFHPLNEQALYDLTQKACDNLSGVNPDVIIEESIRNLFDGISENEVNNALIMSARSLIEKEPNYSYVAARLLLSQLRIEAFDVLKLLDHSDVSYFTQYIQYGVQCGLITPQLADFNLDLLGQALKSERDLQLNYLGVQTLYDRYLLQTNGDRFELPQALFMRVAMGLVINETEKEKRAIEFYNLLSSFDFMCSTPTLFNSGTLRPQLSSCFVSTIEDSAAGIMSAISDNAQLSKYAGGIGNDWSKVRGMGSHIKGTNGKSSGVVPFMKIANDGLVAFNQSGKRRGSGCAYLETWHIDIEEFLELRKNTGDDRRRTHDMNTANWVPDLFMQRVMENGQWTLFSPDETPDLHECYGLAFEEAYLRYESLINEGKIKLYKRISAVDLWRKMLTMLYETGHPWIVFKDACNIRSPQQHVGVVHSSNLCTEITLNTSLEEVAVCFPAGTLILTRDGQKPIEQCDDQEILVPFSDNLTPQQRWLKAKLIPQGEKQVYALSVKNGITIEATEDHPFLVQDPVNHDKPRTYQWKKLRELKAGDFIVCPLNDAIYDDVGQQDADFTAAGWMLGDGWFTQNGSYGACFAPSEKTAQEFVIPILNRWHQASKLGMNAPHAGVPTPYTQPNGVVNWHSERQGFIAYLQQRFGFTPMKSAEKHIPVQIKTAQAQQVSSFLSGLFSADGCVMQDKRLKQGGISVSLSSASQALLCDVQLLLKPFGIHGRIRGGQVTGRGERWQGQLEIHSKHSILNFEQFIGFSLCPEKQAKLSEYKHQLTHRPAFQHAAVVSIVPTQIKEVFDLSLEEDHNFIANGLVVHNCNLGSINLANHITEQRQVDYVKLEKTINTAMRMLDNVIDINYYSIPQARIANLRHRPIGLGMMGFQDALYRLRIPYASKECVDFSDKIMEHISYYAIKTSSDLAKERGAYSTFEGSLWQQGILPIDSIDKLITQRGNHIEMSQEFSLDWSSLREQVKANGMRNSNCMAIAPTATISSICGVTQSIEPTYQNLFVKSNLSGEFTVINAYLVEDLKKLSLWNNMMINELKFYNGSLTLIDRIPEELKKLYATSFEIEPEWLIESASRRQKWIDQSQSLNLYMSQPSGRKMDNLYKLAWIKGLKSTYYLRTTSASQIEKLTVQTTCSITDPDCEACQ